MVKVNHFNFWVLVSFFGTIPGRCLCVDFYCYLKVKVGGASNLFMDMNRGQFQLDSQLQYLW